MLPATTRVSCPLYRKSASIIPARLKPSPPANRCAVPEQRRIGSGTGARGEGPECGVHNGRSIQLRHDCSEILLPPTTLKELTQSRRSAAPAQRLGSRSG